MLFKILNVIFSLSEYVGFRIYENNIYYMYILLFIYLKSEIGFEGYSYQTSLSVPMICLTCDLFLYIYSWEHMLYYVWLY